MFKNLGQCPKPFPKPELTTKSPVAEGRPYRNGGRPLIPGFGDSSTDCTFTDMVHLFHASSTNRQCQGPRDPIIGCPRHPRLGLGPSGMRRLLRNLRSWTRIVAFLGTQRTRVRVLPHTLGSTRLDPRGLAYPGRQASLRSVREAIIPSRRGP